ncbi:MAG: Glu-tRNA(Gln) amidotransferase subunit GatD [Promethearchaeota archaeon]
MVNDEDELQGYYGYVRKELEKAKVRVWSVVEIQKQQQKFRGIILPRSELGDDRHVVLKLDDGYDVGIRLDEGTVIREISRKPAHYKLPEKKVPFTPDKPNVTLLGTGGTVASRLDYRTGAVIPALTPEELFSAVPELSEICNLTPKTLFEILSENMRPEYWIEIAKSVAEEVNEEKVGGIIVAHGTDTMSYTSAALSFMLKNLPVPVVLVGSQRSSDRPSSDAARNLLHAATLASCADIAEVVVCMHGSSSDDYALIHRGTRVRKMHSSRRDAFRTIGDTPIGMVKDNRITMLKKDYRRRKEGQVELDVKLDPKVALLHFYPGMQTDIIDHLVDRKYNGIVLIGTGLGHVAYTLYDSIERAIQEGVTIVMTVQTLWGYTGMNVYESGRKLLSVGVIPGANMLPETALVKLMWVLGHTKNHDEIRKLVTTNLAGEITSRETYDAYIVLQGVENNIPSLKNQRSSIG